jgi:hypothetical protein
MRMNGSRPRATAGRLRDRDAPLTLRDVLTSSKRRTRLELLCWELDVDEHLARPAWELALAHGLLETAGIDPLTGKTMFTISERGRLALRRVGPRRTPTRLARETDRTA